MIGLGANDLFSSSSEATRNGVTAYDTLGRQERDKVERVKKGWKAMTNYLVARREEVLQQHRLGHLPERNRTATLDEIAKLQYAANGAAEILMWEGERAFNLSILAAHGGEGNRCGQTCWKRTCLQVST